MKLSIQGIKDKEAWEKAGIKLPSYDVEKVATATKEAPVWVHFGRDCQIKELHVLKHLIMM